MNSFQVQFLKFGKIAGIHYSIAGCKSDRLVIYGIGAPIPPDNGNLSSASSILDFDVDIYVPDYIGYGRSDGKFTPLNCVKTFLLLFQSFTKGDVGVCGYKNLQTSLKYSEVHFVGRSFGGAYVTLLPRFEPTIKNICAIYPVVDWSTQGKYPNEETIKNFQKAMAEDGYKYLYRGVMSPVWQKHYSGRDGLSPIDNIKYLKNARVFIAHGKKDNNINYRKSEKYYHRLIQNFPNQKDQFKLKLYPFDHSDKTSIPAIVDYLEWANIPKRKNFLT